MSTSFGDGRCSQIYSVPTEEPFVLILLATTKCTSTLSWLTVLYYLLCILFGKCQNT